MLEKKKNIREIIIECLYTNFSISQFAAGLSTYLSATQSMHRKKKTEH